MRNTRHHDDVFIPERNENYQKDLIELRERTIGFFDTMLKLDLNVKEKRKDGLIIAHRLKARIDKLSKKHLEEPLLRLEDLRVHVEEMSDHKRVGIIGGGSTYIAVKDEKSYMIGTWQKGIKVIENCAQVFCDELNHNHERLNDMVYVKPLDSYLLAYNHKLYRKDIDDKPPYLFMDINCDCRIATCFRWSKMNQRLVVNKDHENICVINLRKKQVEIEVKKRIGDRISDFRLFGEDEDMVVAITQDGHVLLYKFNFKKKVGKVVKTMDLELLNYRERGVSLAVCDNGQYILIEIGWIAIPTTSICCKMLLIEFYKDRLIKRANLGRYSHKIGMKDVMEYYGHVGRHVLWVGLSRGEKGLVQVYEYDKGAETLSELELKRTSHEEHGPVKIHKMEDKLYYTGKFGKLMRLSLDNDHPLELYPKSRIPV